MLQYCKNVALFSLTLCAMWPVPCSLTVGRSKKRAGDENLSFSSSDPVSRLPTFLVVPTDRQPSSGYVR